MDTKPKTKKKGFTLVELLVAIAVIGILISLLIPAVGKVMDSARRAKGSNNVKQIALAYNQYAYDDVNGRTILPGSLSDNTDTVNNAVEWSIVLARKGYLNDPNVYCFSGDSAAASVQAKSITTSSTATTTKAWDPSGANSGGADDFSVIVAENIPSDAPMSTTPVVFSRGLQEDGNWNKTKGVYKDKGGFIGFLDGHVEWFENTKDQLVNYSTGEKTSNIKDAVPSDVQWLDPAGIHQFPTAAGS